MTLLLDPQSVLDLRRVFIAQLRFLPQVFFHMHDTWTSKVSEKANPHDFYPNNFNHAFLPKPDFEGYRNNTQKEFEEIQNYVGDEEFHQKPDHPSTFMKMVKERTRKMGQL
jgi:hypothetical protein